MLIWHVVNYMIKKNKASFSLINNQNILITYISTIENNFRAGSSHFSNQILFMVTQEWVQSVGETHSYPVTGFKFPLKEK